MAALAVLSSLRPSLPVRLAARPAAPSAFALLLARYLAGHIAEAQWQALSAVLDVADADAAERNAFASFCLDAIASGEEIALPDPEESGELLAFSRG